MAPRVQRAHGLAWGKGFYGLDLYSLNASIDAVIEYLDVDAAAARARARYGCSTSSATMRRWRLCHRAEASWSHARMRSSASYWKPADAVRRTSSAAMGGLQRTSSSMRTECAPGHDR